MATGRRKTDEMSGRKDKVFGGGAMEGKATTSQRMIYFGPSRIGDWRGWA